MTVAYQGQEGAFSEDVTAALFPEQTRAARRTFAEVFAALETSEVEAAVVPVENTHAGAVADVYDLLRAHKTVQVVAEAVFRVRHCLLGVKGAQLAGVRVARSHPQALAQCEDFLRANNIRPEVAFDTAGAAMEVAAAKDPAVAAIASRRAAQRYGLAVLAADIESSAENYTRFFALGRRDDGAVLTRIATRHLGGPAKTSLVYTTKNQPGALTRSLEPFATAGLQLTKIESRPSRGAPWEYVFYLDFEGDPAASPGREALALMQVCCEWIQLLGTYPAATTVLEPEG
ncbi:MAG TPA: prephenate dehydratase [Candidatus Limnocylindria bacterium]|nr:prephenate dehydratase [Candidatus Limnocylindria bacterium]